MTTAEPAPTAPLPWPTLRRGDTIAVIAPSSPFAAEGMTRGLAFLSEHFRVITRDDLDTRAGYLAGSDARRTEELQAAVDHPEVKGILCARGGYGAMRLLPHLSLEGLSREPKLLVGYSDITALHAQWQRHGVGSLHGSMVAAMGTAPAPLQARWLEALMGTPQRTTLTGLTCITPGRASGLLCGGNLAVLAALLGTPYMPPLAGRVLFLEDVGEAPYRVDRLLTSLALSGLLHEVAAVLLGAFTRAHPGPHGVSVRAVLKERLGGCGKPVLAGLPSGHLDDNLELPFGRPVVVDADNGTVALG